MKIQKNMNQWNTIYFKDLEKSKGSFKKGPFGGALKKSMFVENGVKVYEQKHAIKKDNSIGSYYISKTDFANLKNFEVNPGDFIISCAGTIGEIYRLPENSSKGIINQALIKLTINENKINPDYLKHIFKYEGFKKQLIAQGGVIKNLNLSTLKLVKINCPNIDQQERIAHILSTQEEQIERIKGLIKKLEKRNQYYAEKLLSGELRIRENAETGEAEFYENEEWQDVILNNNNERCPLDWNKKIKLSNISNIINGFPFKTKDMNYEGKYPIIKMSNFKNGVVEINKLSKFTNNNMENYLIQENDLLMGLSGSVGSIAIFKLNRKAFLNQRCLIIRSNDYQDYINYCLKYLIPKYIKNNSFGGVISNLSHKEIENFELIWDNENIKVASIIKNFNEELEKVKQILIKEEKRFQWMLDNLLSGEYEVVED